MSGTGSDNGWLEAAIAWEVCASLHRQYCKGKDALFTTRQSDFVKHAENARVRASHGQAPAGATLPDGWVPLTITHEGQDTEEVAYGPQIMMDRLGKWLGKYFAQAAQAAESVTEPAGVEEGDIDAVALARYKVVPAHESMIHRFAVVAGDGNQQLYLGREVECENMARKFAGAFLGGAFYQVNITPPTQAEDSVQEDALSDALRVPLDSLHADADYLIGRLRDGSMPYVRVIEIIRERIDAAKAAIRARAAHGQAPASVPHLVHSAFAEIAMAFPKAFALHKVGIADTAVREALAAPAPPECETEAEKRAFAFGWFKALESERMKAESEPAVDESYKQALGSKNCMQCCVGYMLGLPLESVPDFVTAGGWDRFASFAESQGYAAVMLAGNHEFEADYLASGTTARGTSHMVVMNDGKLVHDPHPSNAGLVEVQCVWLLAKKSGPRRHRDERAAFEASAKAYTSNVSFERDGTDYADMTASLLWHGWKLRASHGQAPAVATKPTEQQILEAAEKAGLWPNTVHSWIPAFHRYHKELAKAQPAQAQADSVQEDAARLDWLDQQCESYGFQDIHEGNRWEISGPYANVRRAIDYERAARKQGEKQ